MAEEGRSPRERLESMLERAERKGDKMRAEALAEELQTPPFPVALDYLWRAFIRLRARKAPGFSGPEPITWPEIDAFVRRSGLRLTPWECRLVEELDGIYLRVAESRKPSPPPPSTDQGAAPPMLTVPRRGR